MMKIKTWLLLLVSMMIPMTVGARLVKKVISTDRELLKNNSSLLEKNVPAPADKRVLKPSGFIKGNGLRPCLRFLPVSAVIADEAGRRGISQPAAVMQLQHLRLACIRKVSGPVSGRKIIYLRLNIPVLSAYPVIKVHSALPYRFQLTLINRGFTERRHIIESLPRLFAYSVLFEHRPGKSGKF